MDNNLDELFFVDGQNLNENEINNNNDNDNGNNSIWPLIFFLFLVGILLVNELYYLHVLIKDYIFDINNTTDIVFDKCIKFPSLSRLYISVFFILLLIGLIISSIIFHLHNEELFQKLFHVFIYFILYLLGPLLTGFTTLGILFYRRICFSCINNDPNRILFDSYTFLCLICSEFIGINALLVYNNFDTKYNLNNSIRFKENGNYFLGKLFWKATQWRRRGLI